MPDDEVLLRTRRFSVVQCRQRLADGSLHVREVVRHPGAVAIIPLLDDGRVCLIRNQRISVAKTLLELPAGTLEPGEPPLETAQRELVEETGYRADRMELLTAFYPSPGILDERMFLYVASGLTAGAAALEPGEHIEIAPMTWEAAFEMVRLGQIEDGKTIAGLLFYDRFFRHS